MSNKLKTARFFGLAMTFLFCTMSIISIIKGEDETTTEIVESLGASLAAGLATGVLTYFFADKLNADKLFGKKD